MRRTHLFTILRRVWNMVEKFRTVDFLDSARKFLVHTELSWIFLEETTALLGPLPKNFSRQLSVAKSDRYGIACEGYGLIEFDCLSGVSSHARLPSSDVLGWYENERSGLPWRLRPWLNHYWPRAPTTYTSFLPRSESVAPLLLVWSTIEDIYLRKNLGCFVLF